MNKQTLEETVNQIIEGKHSPDIAETLDAIDVKCVQLITDIKRIRTIASNAFKSEKVQVNDKTGAIGDDIWNSLELADDQLVKALRGFDKLEKMVPRS